MKRERDFNVNNSNNPTGRSKRSVKVYTKKKKRDDPESVRAQKLQEKYSEINIDDVKSFADFPLSTQTLKELKENGYVIPTEIQRDTIGLERHRLMEKPSD